MTIQKLRPSEKDILLFLKTLTPFGDRPVKVGTKLLSEKLGITQRTAARSLAELDRLGLVKLERMDAWLSVTPFESEKVNPEVVPELCRGEEPLSEGGRHECPIKDMNVRSKTSMSDQRHPCPIEEPNPSPSLGSKTPQTNKTNKTIQKRERATNFLNFSESNPGFRDFCIRKSQELPDRPVLIESWIIANFEELKGLWLKQQNSGVDQSSAVRQGSLTTPPENSAAVEQTQKFPRVEEAIAAGELRQDSLYRDAVFDNLGNWWKKADWEARHEPAI